MRELANPWHQEYQGRVVVLSLTTEAQRILGPVEYWDLPEVGAKVVANQPLIVVMAKWWPAIPGPLVGLSAGLPTGF